MGYPKYIYPIVQRRRGIIVMKNKEFIVGTIVIVLLYIVITISQVLVVCKSLKVEQKEIRQELENSSHVTESIQN